MVIYSPNNLVTKILYVRLDKSYRLCEQYTLRKKKKKNKQFILIDFNINIDQVRIEVQIYCLIW